MVGHVLLFYCFDWTDTSIVTVLCLFGCVETKCPSQQFFNHVGMESPLLWYNQYFRGVKCLAQGYSTAEVGFEPRPLAPESEAIPLSHHAPLSSFFDQLLTVAIELQSNHSMLQ